MKTKIKTIHEEVQNTDSDKSVGVLLNSEVNGVFNEALFFIYRNNMYIFFETLTDLINYNLYGEDENIRRAYVKEELFDNLYDIDQIDGKFSENIEWV